MERSVLKERAVRGAKRLDEIEPGWVAKITYTLDQNNPNRCVIGQISRHDRDSQKDIPQWDPWDSYHSVYQWWAGRLDPTYAESDVFDHREVMVRYGFNLNMDDIHYRHGDFRTLTECWVEEIEARPSTTCFCSEQSIRKTALGQPGAVFLVLWYIDTIPT